MKKLSLLTLLLVLPLFSFASHLLGGQVYWEALGNNQYIIKLDILADNNGAAIPSNPTVNVTAGATYTANVVATFSSQQLLYCANAATNYTLTTYESQVITLPGSVSGNVMMTFYTCCMPSTYNITGQPAYYISSTMYPSGYNQSSSRFDMKSLFLAETIIPVMSVQPNGTDSSSIELVAPYQNATSTVTYIQGQTYDKPVSSGDVFNGTYFIPGSGSQGFYLLGFKAQNFGLGGLTNSEVRLSMVRPLFFANSNTNPSISIGNGAAWTAVDTLHYKQSVSVGDTVSVIVQASDFDLNPNFTNQLITASLIEADSGSAAITPVSPQSSLSSPLSNQVTFEWVVPSSAMGLNTFYVQMQDDYCDKNGLAAIRLDVEVSNPAVIVDQHIICQGASIQLSAPTTGTTYEWSPNIGLNATNTATVTANPSSVITYTVKVDGVVSGVYTVSPSLQIIPIASQPQSNQIQLDNPGDFTQHAFLYYFVPFAVNDTLVTVNQSGIYHVAGRNGLCYSLSSGVSVLPDTSNGVYLISNPLNDPSTTIFDNQSSYAMDINVGAADLALKIYEVIIPGAELSQKMGSVRLQATDYLIGNVIATGVDVGVGIKFSFPTGIFLDANSGRLELLVDSGSVEIPMVENVTLPYRPTTTAMWVEVSSISGSANGQNITDDMIPFVFRGTTKVGMDEYQQDALMIYPQPADDFIMVDGVEQGQYEIIDLNGRVLSTGEMMDHKMDVSDLRTGMYILKLQNDKGVYTSRIAVR